MAGNEGVPKLEACMIEMLINMKANMYTILDIDCFDDCKQSRCNSAGKHGRGGISNQRFTLRKAHVRAARRNERVNIRSLIGWAVVPLAASAAAHAVANAVERAAAAAADAVAVLGVASRSQSWAPQT